LFGRAVVSSAGPGHAMLARVGAGGPDLDQAGGYRTLPARMAHACATITS